VERLTIDSILPGDLCIRKDELISAGVHRTVYSSDIIHQLSEGEAVLVLSVETHEIYSIVTVLSRNTFGYMNVSWLERISK
jgi:hypothetical protein